MTNTKGVFKTSLDEIKQHDDMNFITGINHSVLHGYNYSPVEAGFPGMGKVWFLLQRKEYLVALLFQMGGL